MRLAADANVLLSASIGGQAKRVLRHPSIETEVTLAEVHAAARKRIGGRDRDDVDLLALAIQLKIPVWSNDNDFENTGVIWYTTVSLLATLEPKSR